MFGRNRWLEALLSLVSAVSIGAVSTQSQTKSRLSIEQLIDIKHPSNPVWSPDGKRVAFIWDRAGVANIYVAAADGGGQPTALTSFPEGQVDEMFWSRDSQSLYFPHGGDLWQVSVSGGSPKAVWTTPARESDIVTSPDGPRVAFVRASAPAAQDP